MSYQLIESIYKDNPIIEITREDGTHFPYDEHFRFGCFKAKLILASMDIINDFVEGMITFTEKTIYSARIGGDIKVERRFNFPFKGQTIYSQWLQLQALNSPDKKIGFGQEKAKALVALSDDIESWLCKYCA